MSVSFCNITLFAFVSALTCFENGMFLNTSSRPIPYKVFSLLGVKLCLEQCDKRLACQSVIYHTKYLTCGLLSVNSSSVNNVFKQRQRREKKRKHRMKKYRMEKYGIKRREDNDGWKLSVLIDKISKNGVSKCPSAWCSWSSICITPHQRVTSPGRCVMEVQKDCWSIFASDSSAPDGVYSIQPAVGTGTINVYCDMTSNGGGWTVLQRRTDGSEDFYRKWVDYKNGFGNLSNEFWIGNDNIYRLTNQRDYIIQFDLEDFSNDRRVASYSQFLVEDESHFYRLNIAGYSGNAGDPLSKEHNNCNFTTKDVDKDKSDDNCAKRFLGAWWYQSCHDVNLNGNYGNNVFGKGINWRTFKGYEYSLKYTAMKIRPV